MIGGKLGGETRGTGPSAALSFLASRTVRNRLRAQARRLQSPRYLVAVAVAILYLIFLIYRPTGGAAGVGAVLPRSAGPGSLQAVTALTAFGFALLVAK